MIDIRRYDDGMWGDDITVTLLHHSRIETLVKLVFLK